MRTIPLERPPSQLAALSAFATLTAHRWDWSGVLLLCVGLNRTGRALAYGALAAGALSLFLEDDPANLRAAQREGCCTFSVATLAEATRALKNEARQGRAIAVAASGKVSSTLQDMVERGLQPAAITFARDPLEQEAPFTAVLYDRGASRLCLSDGSVGVDPFAAGQGWAGWGVGEEVAETLPDRRLGDARLLAVAEVLAAAQGTATAHAALRWLRAAPSLFPRTRERAYLVPPT